MFYDKNLKFCDKLKLIRKNNGITQKALADTLGVSRSCIASWENGSRRPALSYIYKYHDIFDLKNSVFDDEIPEYSLIQNNVMDLSRLNAKGVKELYDFYLSLTKNKEYTKKS